LNAPHVILSSIMLSIAYVMSPREERRDAAVVAAPAPA
jgi:hypothetical protein